MGRETEKPKLRQSVQVSELYSRISARGNRSFSRLVIIKLARLSLVVDGRLVLVDNEVSGSLMETIGRSVTTFAKSARWWSHWEGFLQACWCAVAVSDD